MRAAITVLERLGALLEEVSLPHLRYVDAMHTPIILAEAARSHEPYLRTRTNAYQPDVHIGLEMATGLRPADYAEAQRLRSLLRRDYADAFTRVDVIVHPCLPVPAPQVGETMVTIGNETEPLASALIRLNSPANR